MKKTVAVDRVVSSQASCDNLTCELACLLW